MENVVEIHHSLNKSSDESLRFDIKFPKLQFLSFDKKFSTTGHEGFKIPGKH